MKKVLSIVLAIMLIASLAPTMSFADDAAPDILVLADFGNPETFTAESMGSNFRGEVSSVAYPGKSSSLKYTLSYEENADFNFVLNDAQRSLSAYNTDDATINVRFYSNAVGSRANLIYWNTENWSGNYYPVPTNSDASTFQTFTGDWQVFSIPFKLVYAKTGDTLSFRINDAGWSNESFNEGDEIWVDSIWIDLTSADGYKSDVDSLVVWDSERGDLPAGGVATAPLKSDPTGKFVNYRSYATAKTNAMYAVARDMTRTGTTDDYKTIFNTSGYTYINAWVYSPKPQDSGFVLQYWTSLASTSSRTNSHDGVKMTASTYQQVVIQHVNWTGWKLISLKLPTTALDVIIIQAATSNGKPANTSNWPENNVNVEFGLGSFWLSKGTTSPQAHWEASKTYGNVATLPFAEGDISVADYNTPSKVTAVNSTAYSVSATDENSHLYDMVARFSWNTMRETDFPNGSSANSGQMDVYGSAENTSAISVNNNSYINLWIYNPEIKYAFDAKNYADISLNVGYYDTASSSTVVNTVSIMASWEGWKLHSIPVSAFGSDLVANGINYIYIAANKGVYASAATNYIYERTQDEINQGYAIGGSNAFAANFAAATNLNNDRRNYMDFERIWISDGAASNEFTLFESEIPELICPEEAWDMVEAFSFDEEELLKWDMNVMKSNAQKAESSELTYDDGVLIINDGFDYGETYSVALDLYAKSGRKETHEYVFKTENYHVSGNEEAQSMVVTMHGNLPEDYRDSVIVAAVYEKDTNRLVSATPAYLADGQISAAAEDFDSATQTLKFIFVNGFEGMKPLEANIRN